MTIIKYPLIPIFFYAYILSYLASRHTSANPHQAILQGRGALEIFLSLSGIWLFSALPAWQTFCSSHNKKILVTVTTITIVAMT